MRMRLILAILLTFGVSLATFGTVFALEGVITVPPPACVGDNVSGTVIAVDEISNMVTILTDSGEVCTVTLDESDYKHPVTSLLGQYFDDIHPDNLVEALGYTVGCAIPDPMDPNIPPAWLWVTCDTPGAITVTVTGGSGGVFTATANISDTWVINSLLITDTIVSGDIENALIDLMVGWQLISGTVVEAADKIAAYHDEGMGFGVLTKLFALADEIQYACEMASGDPLGATDPMCAVTVDDLVSLFRDQGVGLGQLFKIYWKPEKRGVGHIRKALQAENDAHPGNGNGPPAERGNGRFSDNTSEMDESYEDFDHPGKRGKADKNKPGNGRGHRGPPAKKDKPKK